MRRNKIRRFLQQKQYAIASLILFVAIAGMTGVYLSNRIVGQKEEAKVAQEKNDAPEKLSDYAIQSEDGDMNLTQEKDVESVTSVIKPKETKASTTTGQGIEGKNQTKSTPSQPSRQQGSSVGQENTKDNGRKQETSTQAKAAELHFSPKTDLTWPLQGDVILNYSMDQTVYFATLDQYKYNPALIIAGKVNDPVKAAAAGKITDISTNEETGVTVTMDLGDGYSAVYGQLKEVLYKEGAVIEAGNAIGYIAEPTKYYSVEGSNLYFELLKDEKPVDPMQYIE